jgi:hypothetical protein
MTPIGSFMRVIGIAPFTGPAANRAGPQAVRDNQRAPSEDATTGTAVIPLAAPSPHRTIHSSGRPDAAFVAHLIATADHAPQTRMLRRAAPADAVTRYRLAGDMPVANTTTGISRTA